MRLTVGSLFSGIGGLELGLERAGMEVVWQVEKDDYCRRVLAKHWPDVERFEDVRDVGAENLEPVDLICGGFPCQPVSIAGRQERERDDRWLWPEFARVVREIRPQYAVVENVPGLLTGGMGQVLGDLATLRFDAEWESIPAGAVGAPHLRRRVFIVAYPNSVRAQVPSPGRQPAEQVLGGDGPPRRAREVDDTMRGRHGAQEKEVRAGWISDELPSWWTAEPGVGRVADGVPDRVDRIRALGNAVVPQVAEWIGRRIVEHAERMEAQEAAA